MKIIRNYLSSEELQQLADSTGEIMFRSSPDWLGNFYFCMFGAKSRHKKVPEGMRGIVRGLASLVPEQRFNTAFVQRYHKGSVVKPHRDPKNNIGYTVIAPFGTWTGAESTYDGKTYEAKPGDVVVQECTIGGRQGLIHSVARVNSGIRYVLILNTII